MHRRDWCARFGRSITALGLAGIGLAALAIALIGAHAKAGGVTTLRFEVSVGDGLLKTPKDGRLLVVMGPKTAVEPWRNAVVTGPKAEPVLGRDVNQFKTGSVAIVDNKAAAFPIADLAHLPAGDYAVQAFFDWNPDLRIPAYPFSPPTPGTLYSDVRRVHLDPAQGGTVRLELTHEVPPETPPPATERLRFIRLRSRLLSAFHGRPIYLRAGIRLPRNFDEQPNKRYPLRVHIGGFGSRYFDFPREDPAGDDMVTLVLDGDGPYGDPYQVNSDNNGPYGDAITQELIPDVENHARCIGKPYARVLDGGSTGGWVSLALQVFYPDFFNGTWSACPDPVDFRSFQLVDIYQSKNAYANRFGFERPGMRTTDGDVQETMRYECQIENVLGRGDSWAMSGQQWGSWNAVFGPRGRDGRPVPLWNPRTGLLDHHVAQHWQRYDLRQVLEKNWPRLGPKLQGKIHIWVGDADSYFLNNAVHRLDDFLSKAKPAYGGTIVYAPGKGHCWDGLTERQKIEQMLAAVRTGAAAARNR